MSTLIYANCMAGTYHIDDGLPCQDSYAIKEKDDLVIASVADGLGSELYSEIGSSIAADYVVNYCSDKITSDMNFENAKKIMYNSYVEAYKAILAKAKTDGNSQDEYDTTLCLAVYNYKTKKLMFGQSGDSGIVALLTNGKYLKVTEQQRDEDKRVYPLCFGPEKWEFGQVDDVSAIALMTDGIFEQFCPNLLKRSEININVPLAAKFLDRFDYPLDKVDDLQKASDEYLKNYPRYLLDDDKTIVAIINKDAVPCRQDDDYYKAPDWEELLEEREKMLHPDLDPMPQVNEVVSTDLKDHEEALSDKIEPIDKSVETATNSLLTKQQPIMNHNNYCDSDTSIKKIELFSTSEYSFFAAMAILMFSVLAWLSKDFIQSHLTFGLISVLIICFISNASILLPSASLLVVVESAVIMNPLAVALFGAIGCAAGELVGYYFGKFGITYLPLKGKYIQTIREKLVRHDMIIVFVFAFLPLPIFDVVGVISGAVGMDKIKFYISCLAGKLLKMLIYVSASKEILALLN